MAQRPAFLIRQGRVVGETYSFQWFPGFAVSQKQKSIASLHAAIRSGDGEARPLEISTKSGEELGRKLSAFHLKLGGHTLENVFQSAKVFEEGGPYPDLLKVPPREAKHDGRLKTSGPLKAFSLRGEEFPLEPKTVFYDYIYLAAVGETLTAEELRALSEYNYFTDIEFNPAKSLNTQARTAALLKLLLEEYHSLPEMQKDAFLRYHREHVVY